MALVDLFTYATLTEVKAKIAQFAALGGLDLTSWYAGSPGEQLYQAFAQALAYFTRSNAQFVRGFFLDYATDPGDPDPFDPTNEALPPAPGFLSALGENCFFTVRPGATFATTAVTMTNGANVPYTFGPDELTIAHADDATITYRNSADPTFYTGTGGTYTLYPGTAIDVDFAAEEAGTAFNALAGKLTAFVTALPGVTVNNAAAALGSDRMTAVNYRALCRTQASTTSPNGVVDAYLRWSRLNRDGTPLLNASGAAVGITKVQVVGSGVTGEVLVYYADDDAAADAADVTAANANITANILGVGDCITFTGAAATNTDITVTWAVEYLATFNGAAVTGATVKAAINTALSARFKLYPIGGFKQTAGAGTISLEEIRGTVKGAHAAISDVTLSSPVGATVIAIGRVPRLTTPTGTETAV
jgi:hypothetical protein